VLLREVIGHARTTGDVYSLAMALADLGFLRAQQGDIEEGIRQLEEHVDLLEQSRQPWRSHEMQASGAPGHALWRVGRADDARSRAASHVRDWWSQHRSDPTIPRLCDALGQEQLEAAMEEGSQLSVDDAVALAQRGRGPRRRPSSGWQSLTPTELQVVELVA